MPSVKDPTEAPADVPAVDTEPIEGTLEGFDDGLAWIRHRFRGVDYKLVELPIGEYDEIQKRATRKERVTDPDTGNETEVELLDQQLQSRMMLKACIVEPEKVDVTKMGTRLIVTLNRAVNRLHYGEELDELRSTKPAEDGDEGKAKGKG